MEARAVWWRFVPFSFPTPIESEFDRQADQRKMELGIIASLSRRRSSLCVCLVVELEGARGGREEADEQANPSRNNNKSESNSRPLPPPCFHMRQLFICGWMDGIAPERPKRTRHDTARVVVSGAPRWEGRDQARGSPWAKFSMSVNGGP